jgi:hypothetical protein
MKEKRALFAAVCGFEPSYGQNIHPLYWVMTFPPLA